MVDREIEFRAWDDGFMVYFENISILKHQSTIIEKLTVYFATIRSDAILMQYTGLKDKNGKKIFEGDIVKFENIEKNAIVGWSGKCASFVLDKKGWMYSHYFGECCEPDEVEVIGNIYENPEFLESN